MGAGTRIIPASGDFPERTIIQLQPASGEHVGYLTLVKLTKGYGWAQDPQTKKWKLDKTKEVDKVMLLYSNWLDFEHSNTEQFSCFEFFTYSAGDRGRLTARARELAPYGAFDEHWVSKKGHKGNKEAILEFLQKIKGHYKYTIAHKPGYRDGTNDVVRVTLHPGQIWPPEDISEQEAGNIPFNPNKQEPAKGAVIEGGQLKIITDSGTKPVNDYLADPDDDLDDIPF